MADDKYDDDDDDSYDYDDDNDGQSPSNLWSERVTLSAKRYRGKL